MHLVKLARKQYIRRDVIFLVNHLMTS